jgi:cysteine synthase A
MATTNSQPAGLNRYPSRLPATPLVPVRLAPDGPAIWCKLEFLNPSGSTKDRIARYILGNAFERGDVKPGDMVIEASSGSTSIAMSLVCAQLGLRFIAVVPEGVSNERAMMIRAYGGTVRFSDKQAGIAGCIRESERLAAELGAYLPRQFYNPENSEAHRYGTAPEILEQSPGHRVDAVVSGVGTGGTLMGLVEGCADHGQRPHAVLARPVDLSRPREQECCSFSCRIPGVLECVSTIFREEDHPELITIEVPDEDAIRVTRELIRRGFPVGPSSGLNYCAAANLAARMPDAVIVTVLPDRMERYFTTELFKPYST